MKYIITESKLEETIINYLDELFDIQNLHHVSSYEYDNETGEEWEDDNRIVFYVGDYEGDDDGCFYWYSCDYFGPNSPVSEKCPIVGIEPKYENQLDGYFGNVWQEPFKKWVDLQFGLPVKTIM
jgi:hypothetical protein